MEFSTCRPHCRCRRKQIKRSRTGKLAALLLCALCGGLLDPEFAQVHGPIAPSFVDFFLTVETPVPRPSLN